MRTNSSDGAKHSLATFPVKLIGLFEHSLRRQPPPGVVGSRRASSDEVVLAIHRA